MFRVKGSGREAFEVNGCLQDVRSDFSERGGGCWEAWDLYVQGVRGFRADFGGSGEGGEGLVLCGPTT